MNNKTFGFSQFLTLMECSFCHKVFPSCSTTKDNTNVCSLCYSKFYDEEEEESSNQINTKCGRCQIYGKWCDSKHKEKGEKCSFCQKDNRPCKPVDPSKLKILNFEKNSKKTEEKVFKLFSH